MMEFKKLLAEHRGFIKVYWNDDPEVEKKIKEETKAPADVCRCLCKTRNQKLLKVQTSIQRAKFDCVAFCTKLLKPYLTINL